MDDWTRALAYRDLEAAHRRREMLRYSVKVDGGTRAENTATLAAGRLAEAKAARYALSVGVTKADIGEAMHTRSWSTVRLALDYGLSDEEIAENKVMPPGEERTRMEEMFKFVEWQRGIDDEAR